MPAARLVFFYIDNPLPSWYNSTKLAGKFKMLPRCTRFLTIRRKMPMIPDDASTLTQYAGGLFASFFAFLYLLQKFFNGWKSDKAENSVITLMHTELERLCEQNTKLAEELGKLQEEIISLNKQLRSLTVENQQLHAEVALLTHEVSRLQGILKRNITDDPSKNQF